MTAHGIVECPIEVHLHAMKDHAYRLPVHLHEEHRIPLEVVPLDTYEAIRAHYEAHRAVGEAVVKPRHLRESA